MNYPKESSCELCHRQSATISQTIGICRDCLVTGYDSAYLKITTTHARARKEFNLPGSAPQEIDGVSCKLCSNECLISEGQRGFCGLRAAQNGRLVHLAGTPGAGLLHWYRDPLPTNCVADWVCEGSQHSDCHNLAVFYKSCTADCLFCQNWYYRQARPRQEDTISSRELAAQANRRTFCVCYFGGDPSSQMPHALATSKYLAHQGVRICWETNGMQHPKLMRRAVEYSNVSGGCVKFDLKAYHESLHIALSGVSNQRTLENFTLAGMRFADRPEPPPVIASTLLIPGYIESEEVKKIAQFIASINPDIPYTLLAYAPNFFMSDLPVTSTPQAQASLEAARQAGLRNVRIGNRQLLGLGELM
jgi:pyruvate formate lyase activating enzyme